MEINIFQAFEKFANITLIKAWPNPESEWKDPMKLYDKGHRYIEGRKKWSH